MGIPLPDDFYPQFNDILSTVKADPNLRPINVNRTPPHITIYFFGTVGSSSTEQIVKAVEECVGVLQGTRLRVGGGLDVFGGNHPRVLYLKVLYPPKLEKFYHQIDSKLAHYRSVNNESRFSPHITIARFKHPKRWDKESAIEQKASKLFWDFPVTEIDLYGINVKAGKEKHEVIHRFSI